jgi:hypothetical protein
MFSANAELIRLYCDIGRAIAQRQQRKGWGSGVIPRLARDLRNELPEVKGFFERNIKLMTQFYRQYPSLGTIGQPVVAQLPPAFDAGQANAGYDTQAVTAISPPPVAKSPAEQVAPIVQQLAALSITPPGPATSDAIVPQAVA